MFFFSLSSCGLNPLLFLCAAFAQRQVAQVPEQPDAARPHHQVAAAPPQEEEAAEHQRTVPGQPRLPSPYDSNKNADTS